MLRLLLVILIAAVVIALFSGMLSQCGWSKRMLLAPLPHNTPIQTDPKTIILNQLRQVNELASSVMGIVAIVSSDQTKKVAGLEIGSTNLLYMGVGKIRAGVDLSELTEQSLRIDGKHVSLSLPPVKVLDVSLDVERSQVLNVARTPLLSPRGDALQSAAEQRALEEMRAAATNERWVREAMEEQSFEMVKNLMKVLGVTDFSVEWEVVENG